MKLQGSNILGQEQIDLLTTRGLNFVWFPKQLETIYRFQYQNGAAYEFRYRAPIILILYLFLSFGIYQVLPTEQVLSWLSYYSWVGIIVLIAWILSFIKKLNQWFDYYVGIGSSAAVAITFILINVLENGQDNVLFHAAMMYAIVIIYGAVGMRFYTAIIAGWVGGLIGILVSTYLNGDIDWTFLNRTYTFSSFLGMTLAYATDRQHRENYLQNCMIELNRIELMQQAQQLSLLSQQDALTGLANRRYLDETLDNEWRRALRHETPLTIMMVDIDFFKPYNDSLGHLKGDQCLKDIATAISSIAARSGDLVARYGGEEFLLLFPMTNAQQAKIQAERLMNAIKKIAIVHPCSSVSPYVTISVGVATTIPRLNDSISAFVSRADHALYQAKTNGRNQYQIALNEEQIVDLT
ncbi:TPA: GGDEF domain-containing protein [Acinetobacter baumannii]|jgi:diguanylate cyclase (GGDEF) domain|uniref:diguanylate cyclase n=103 Tax=Acinetobacter calcoaceticus/baumannii complex TaxID=909768 RepID=D0C7F2_ACIB2|nr:MULTISPECIES: GGDEF domain-containing protein [Acinetobacter]ADX92373.1 GGDEF domain-containing protein [Acinetobacter baumannii TCDC-AB0715]AHX27249.1 diguanylate cyclase [Acinetobacter baumannii AC12]AHX64495.1 diguanylate cyclase [Acinetobacter baumannii AC30]EMT96795.1 diguanylate cyclase [Acinetobacter baumannii ABNIH6]EXB51542.1 diguanylate cyclase domain protein [Acinetobacter baumannii 1440422]EXG35669.1 diguanylate cyclase domain protein [Acinetobacter baumannii 121738]EYD02272.1